MPFACQRDSYMKEYTTTIISCEKGSQKILVDKKLKQQDGYEVILEDTILFPEGGGQPDDAGTINGVVVKKVFAKNSQAVHFTTEPLQCGDNAHVILDWERRFDHMQQHSGQHLITAFADGLYGFTTTSWNLGTDVSSIELDTVSMEQSQISELESIVNERIRQRVPVNVQVYSEDSEELKKVRTRGLPENHRGPVRVVTIEGVESNMCCGTHVSNLADLQAIKLLYAEKGKKNKTNLFFVAGNRVLRYLGNCVDREKGLTAFLKGGPEQHIELVDKMQKLLKSSQKNELNLIRDLALLEAAKFNMIQPRPKFLSLHRREEIPDFMSIIVNEINDQGVTIFISIGDERGQVCLSGERLLVDELSPKICELLDGKGFTKANKFQCKVKNLSKRAEVEDLIKEKLGIQNS